LLRRTFTPESINPLWLHAISGKGKSERLCPSCRNPMLEVALSGSAQVAVDVCQHCHFVWFDAHEMDTLAPRQSPVSVSELPQKARELIAIEKVKQIAEEAAAPISTARRRMKHGNKSQASLDYRLNSKHRKRSENHGQPGYFPRQSFA